METETKLELQRVHGQVLAVAGCLVDLYGIVSKLSAAMPIVGGVEGIHKDFETLEARIKTLFDRLERLEPQDGD